MLFLMKSNTALLVFVLLMISSCTRRPVQKDVVLNNDPADRITQHRTMVGSPGAADAPYELQFIDTMIGQHEVSIDTLQLAATRAQRSEVKQFSRSTLNDLRKEIAELRQMRSDWFGEDPPAINVDLPGMQEVIAGVDLNRLDLLKEAAFDIEFVRQMTLQNESAVKLANDALQKNVRPELKKLAETIANARSNETEKLRGWERERTK